MTELYFRYRSADACGDVQIIQMFQSNIFILEWINMELNKLLSPARYGGKCVLLL